LTGSLDLLEYPQLKELIGRYVAGPLGRAELERLEPSTDQQALEGALAEVREAVEYARTSPKLPLGGLVDSTMPVAKLRIEGAGLDGREIADLIVFLERASEVRTALLEARDNFPLLAARAGRVGEFRGLLRDISDVLSKEKINVTAVRSQSKSGIARMAFTIELPGLAPLQRLLALVGEVPGVANVRRG